jgi:hypothetical protein
MEGYQQESNVGEVAPAKPEILSVLNITVIVGNSLAILLALAGILMGNDGSGPALVALSFIIPSTYIVGAVYMMKLKKAGFFIYMSGKLVKLVLLLTTSGEAMAKVSEKLVEQGIDMPNFGTVVIGLLILFWAIFPIFYLFMYKHFR